MNYQKIYNQIIERAQNRQIEGYVENHHIIPKCAGGTEEKNNMILLTAREHFICHRLLPEIYPNNDKVRYAMFMMNVGKSRNKNADYKISNRTYERLKLEHSLFLTGKKQRQNTRDKKSKSMTKVWAGKTKEEMSAKAKKACETRRKNNNHIISEEQRQKHSKALMGRNITWTTGNAEILQYDLEGNFIQEWISIAEATRQIGGDIQSAVIGKKSKTAAGFKWKYKYQIRK